MGDEGLERWPPRRTLELARLVIEALQGLHFLVAPELCVLHRRFEHTDGFVIDLDRYGIGMAVLAAMRQREAGRIGEAVRRAMHDFGDHRQRTHRAQTDARRQQQLRKIDWPALGRRGERAVQATAEYIA